MGSDHKNPLYRTVINWLSHGNWLLKVVEFKDQLRIFLLQKDKCSEFADFFCDDECLSVACYLAVTVEKKWKKCSNSG